MGFQDWRPAEVQTLTPETVWDKSGIVAIVGSTGAGKTVLAQRLVKSALSGEEKSVRFLVYTVWPADWTDTLDSLAVAASFEPGALLEPSVWPVAVVGVEQQPGQRPCDVAPMLTRQIDEARSVTARLHVIVDDAWWFVSHRDPRSFVPDIVDACLPVLANNGTLTLLVQTGIDMEPREAALTSAVITVNNNSYNNGLVSEGFGIPEELHRDYRFLRRG